MTGRIRQAWTIARIELRRVFFAKRSFWVFGLALLPGLIFLGHGLDMKFRGERLARRGITPAPLMESIRQGESTEQVKNRLGQPAEERWSVRTRRVRARAGNGGATTHVIEPTVEARFVRLNVTRPSYSGEPVARIYEFEVYGPDGRVNLALRRPVTGSLPCSPDEGPEKAVNGSVAGGQSDRWCGEDWPLFLQVDLGYARPVSRFVVKHASAGGEVGHVLVGGDVFGAAVGVAAVIQRVDVDENVARAEHLGPGQCEGEENRVARGYVGHWNVLRHFIGRTVLGHGDVAGERRSAEDAEIDIDDDMLRHFHRSGYSGSG